MIKTHVRDSLLALAIVVALFTFIALPQKSFAVGTQANAMCNPVDMACPCGQVMGPHGCIGGMNMHLCPCQDTTNGFGTAGICVAANKCLAQSTNGGGLTDPSKLLEALKGLMDALKGGGGGGGGGGSQQPPTTNPTGQTGCTTYTQVSTPSADPCAIYVPAIDSLGSTSNAISNDLLNALNGTNNLPGAGTVPSGTNANGTNTNNSSTSNSNSNANNNANNVSANASANIITSGITTAPGSSLGTPTILNTNGAQPVGLAPGIAGDLQVAGNGATVVVTNQNSVSNSVTAGFYGSDVMSGQPQSLVAGWCQTQPWKKNFLSGIIPPTFFDSLCLLRGFKVGLPVIITTPVPLSSLVPKAVKPAPIATTTPVVPYVKPQADIWAVPATVPLAARTTIFWSTKGVTSCTESSPDGSFSHTTLQGGAATVPLSGATTFTISCDAPDGSHITNFVTVGLSI